MPHRIVVFGVLTVVVIALVVMLVESFLPLSFKIEMNIECRKSLLEMESAGGLDNIGLNSLEERLSEKGFYNISITAPENAKQGDEIRLKVEADYKYSKFQSVFSRQDVVSHLIYDKTTMSRKVIN